MKRLLFLPALLIIILGAGLWTGCGKSSGDTIILRATHELGVPLHQEAGGIGGFVRVAEGTEAVVVGTARNGEWLNIELSDGRTGWISGRYVARQQPAPRDNVNPAFNVESEVWASAERCLRIVEPGGRMAPNGEDIVRVGTWNIRWFPRGCSSGEDCATKTNVPWLACTIAWMNVDVLAVQEVLADSSAQHGMNDLLRRLNGLTRGDWAVDLHECGAEGAQHVGFLWNRAAVALTDSTDLPELNGAAEDENGCAGNLRPGRYANVSAAGGVDFQVVSVHLDSGRNDRDYQHRRAAMRRVPSIRRGDEPLRARDEDVIILGDFNTMGRSEPSEVTEEQEVSRMEREIGRRYRRAPLSPPCTEYYRNLPGTLDHIVVAAAMEEAAQQATVTGYCAIQGCAPLEGDEPPAARQLSDHCPVILEIRNVDLDPAF